LLGLVIGSFVRTGRVKSLAKGAGWEGGVTALLGRFGGTCKQVLIT